MKTQRGKAKTPSATPDKQSKLPAAACKDYWLGKRREKELITYTKCAYMYVRVYILNYTERTLS